MIENISAIYVIPILLLLLGVTIFIHELGHYLLARWLGFVVEVFSVGFGPAIWKKKYNGIVYKIGWIPIGGYVAIPQLDPTGMALIQGSGEGEAGEEKKDAAGAPVLKYPPMAPWKKIVVAFAGGVGNMVLAVIIAWAVYLIGMPAGPSERSAMVGHVDRDSKAYAQGLRTGDDILEVNGTAVKNWRSFAMEAALHPQVVMRVRSADSTEKTITIPTERGMLGEQTVVGVRGLGLCSILQVQPGMSAEKAGLKAGDVIVGFGDGAVYSMEHFVELINQHSNESSPIKVMRIVNGKRALVSTKVTPMYDEETSKVRIGIMWNLAAVEADTIVKPLPSEQLKEHATAIFRFLKAIMTPKQAKAAATNVGGPVAIMISYWYIVKASIMLAIWFTGLLNVNLAILNLLPIPVLDGGHIMFSLWEWVARKPASPKLVNALVNVFVVLIMGFLVFITFRDMDRLTPARRFFKYVAGKFHGDSKPPFVQGQRGGRRRLACQRADDDQDRYARCQGDRGADQGA